jgi:hypothetical protein
MRCFSSTEVVDELINSITDSLSESVYKSRLVHTIWSEKLNDVPVVHSEHKSLTYGQQLSMDWREQSVDETRLIHRVGLPTLLSVGESRLINTSCKSYNFTQ